MRIVSFACASLALASVIAPAKASAQVTVSGNLTVVTGTDAQAWYGDVTVSSGSSPVQIDGDLTITGPLACAEHRQCASGYCGTDGYCGVSSPLIAITGVGSGELTNAVVRVCYSVTGSLLLSDEGTLDGVPFTGRCADAVFDGSHHVTVTATSSGGSTSSAQLTFFIDRTPPAVAFTEPAAASSVDTPTVDVAVTASDVWGIAGVRLNGVEMTLAPDGRYRRTTSIQMGANQLVVTATDVAGNESSSTQTVYRVPPPALTGIAVASLTSSWRAGSTGQLTATASYSDTSMRDVTGQATWASSDEGVASIVSPGVVQAVAAGFATITVSLNGISGATTLAVTAASSQLALNVSVPVQAFETQNSSVSVQGTVRGGLPTYWASVNGVDVHVAANGEFATMLPLALGAVNIRVEATDSTGETVSRVISGTRSPPSTAVLGGTTTGGNPAAGRIRYLHDRSGNLTQVIDTYTDVNNCGGLELSCGSTPSAACQDGRCGVIVGGVFVDVNEDPLNCGAPNHQCEVPAHGQAVCTAGLCGITCETTYVSTGTSCVDLLSDPAHCGRLEHSCDDAAAVCVSGRCVNPATPVPISVNGVVAPGLAFRSPMWSGIRIEGAGLDNVTYLELEDWGADVDAQGQQAAPLFSWLMAGLPVAFTQTPTSITIPQPALQHLWNCPDFVPPPVRLA